jgi:DNA-binding ferritin-like protein
MTQLALDGNLQATSSLKHWLAMWHGLRVAGRQVHWSLAEEAAVKEAQDCLEKAAPLRAMLYWHCVNEARSQQGRLQVLGESSSLSEQPSMATVRAAMAKALEAKQALARKLSKLGAAGQPHSDAVAKAIGCLLLKSACRYY